MIVVFKYIIYHILFSHDGVMIAGIYIILLHIMSAWVLIPSLISAPPTDDG